MSNINLIENFWQKIQELQKMTPCASVKDTCKKAFIAIKTIENEIYRLSRCRCFSKSDPENGKKIEVRRFEAHGGVFQWWEQCMICGRKVKCVKKSDDAKDGDIKLNECYHFVYQVTAPFDSVPEKEYYKLLKKLFDCGKTRISDEDVLIQYNKTLQPIRAKDLLERDIDTFFKEHLIYFNKELT